MKHFGVIILLLVIRTNTQIKNAERDHNTFPKLLWTYWDSGYEGASLFTKLCINNMIYYTEKSQWKFQFLTKENITDFISKESQQRITKIIQTSKHYLTVQNHVDIYRLFLVYENGGMWLDTNSFFLEDLAWIQNISQEKSVYNKLNDDPQIITFSYNQQFGGNKSRILNEHDEEIYLFPGIQIWSFIAKPKCKFIYDIIENLQHSLITSKADLDLQSSKMGIIYGQQSDIYFITSNYQFQTVLQKKQKEIQSKPQSYQQKYAIQYYKIWSVDALQSAFALFQMNDWTAGSVIQSLFHDSVQSYFERYQIRIRFIKFTTHFYPQIGKYLPYIQFASCISAIQRISTQSIIYQQLFLHSSKMPIIKGIISQATKVSQDSQCNLHLQNKSGKIVILVVLAFITLLALNVGLFYMYKSTQQRDNYKIEFLKLSTNSDK